MVGAGMSSKRFLSGEDTDNWPAGLLDAHISMIPKVDGDSTPLGQRPLCVLPVIYRLGLRFLDLF